VGGQLAHNGLAVVALLTGAFRLVEPVRDVLDAREGLLKLLTVMVVVARVLQQVLTGIFINYFLKPWFISLYF